MRPEKHIDRSFFNAPTTQTFRVVQPFLEPYCAKLKTLSSVLVSSIKLIETDKFDRRVSTVRRLHQALSDLGVALLHDDQVKVAIRRP